MIKNKLLLIIVVLLLTIVYAMQVKGMNKDDLQRIGNDSLMRTFQEMYYLETINHNQERTIRELVDKVKMLEEKVKTQRATIQRLRKKNAAKKSYCPSCVIL